MTKIKTPTPVSYPRYSRVEQWQYEHIVLAGKEESIKWTDRRNHGEAQLFAQNPALSTGRIRNRTIVVSYRDKKDFRGTVVYTHAWKEESIDQSSFDPLTSA